MWAAIASVVTNVFGGIFGMKKQQGEVIAGALGVVGDINASEGERERAVATIIQAESNAGGIAAMWRPLTALLLLLLIVFAFFGVVPPHFNDPMSPMLARIFDIFEVCLYGYIPARTIDKIAKTLSIGKIIRTYIEKKIL